MNRSIHNRSRSRLAGLAAMAVAAGVLAPLAGGSASAEVTVQPPAAPALLGPLSAGPVIKDVVLDWKAVGDADSYVVELGTDDDWSDEAVHTEKTPATEVALPSWLPHASYLWRVAAVKGGVQGAWSRNGTFTRGWRERPELVTPALDASVEGRPTFSWSPVAGASAYQLQISTSTTFGGSAPLDAAPTRDQGSPEVDTCYTTRTEITPFTGKLATRMDGAGDCVFTLLGSGKTVYWRVRALDRYVDASTEIPTTPGSSAGISYLPPSASDEELVSDCPTGKAPEASPSPSASAAPSPSASPSPSPGASPTPSPIASPSPAPLAGEAGKPGGCTPNHPVDLGAWSAYRTLTATYGEATSGSPAGLSTVTVQPLPSYCAPSTGSAVCDDFPTLRWQPVAGASRYRIYIALNDDFSNIHTIAESSALTWTDTAGWRESSVGESYYYAVQACTTVGCGPVPPASVLQTQTFRKKSPAARTVTAKRPQSTFEGVELRWEDYGTTRRTSGGRTETAGAYA